jgi:hypothetical protein
VQSAVEQQIRAVETFLQGAGKSIPQLAHLRELWASSTAKNYVRTASLVFDDGDVARAKDWLGAARNVCPAIVAAPSYRRLALKIRLGKRISKVLSGAASVFLRLRPRLFFKAKDQDEKS